MPFSGYYRVNYDKRNWKLLIEQLHGSNFNSISTINRAQLLDDALNLARANRLDYTTALDLMSYLKQETDYIPWKAAFTAMTFIDNLLVNHEGYDRFKVCSIIESITLENPK